MKNVLVAVDFSDVTERVVSATAEMARAFSAKVWVFHCVSDYHTYAPLEQVPVVFPDEKLESAEQFADQHRQLASIVSSLQAQGIQAEPLLAVGIASDEIAFVTNKYFIDYIVMGSHGHGALHDLVVGSVAKSVLKQTHRPVLIVPVEVQKDQKTVPVRQWEEPMATPY